MLQKNARIVVENCYRSVAVRTVFVSRKMLPPSRKNVQPAIQKSTVIYEHKCHCDSRYVGRTAQRLQDRIKQHIPNWLRQHTGSHLTESVSENNPIQNVTQQLDNTYQKTTDLLPVTIKINFLFWTRHAVLSISVGLKPATSAYGDLIYANGKSLSVFFKLSK